MNQKMRNLLIYTTAFFLTIICLYMLLLISALIPNELIKPNMQKSAEIYKTKEAFTFEKKNILNTVSDNYADSILLGISYNMGRGNPFISTIDTRYHKGDNIGENYGLYITVTNDAKPDTNYTRYFHGSAMFVRFFHLLGDVNLVKNINFVVIILLVFLTLIILNRKKYYDIILALILSLLMVKFYNIRLSIEYQSAFLVCFIMCPLYILFEKKLDTSVIILSVVGGVLTAFFDFLTCETITILFPLMLIVAIRAKEERFVSFKQMLMLVTKCLVAWGIAYVGTFLLKWMVASLVTGENEFILALSSVAERFGGKILLNEKPENIFSAVFANFAMLINSSKRGYSAKTPVAVFLFLMIIFSIWYVFKSKNTQKGAAGILLFLAIIPLIRFFVLNNHSFLHCFFTYRALFVSIFAIILSAFLNMRNIFGRKVLK